MVNKLQKLLYNMSIFSPCFLLLHMWSWWQNKILTNGEICSIFINGILCIWFYIYFIPSCEKKLPKEKISIENCVPNGSKVIDLGIGLVPIVMSFFNLPIGLLLYLILVIFITLSNTNFVSPLLFFIRPHLYEIKPSGGIDGYLLATNKKLSNNNQITEVKEVFKYFLIN